MSPSLAGYSGRTKKRKKQTLGKHVFASGSSPPPPYEQAQYSDIEKDEKRSKKRKADNDQSSIKTGTAHELILETGSVLTTSQHQVQARKQLNGLVMPVAALLVDRQIITATRRVSPRTKRNISIQK